MNWCRVVEREAVEGSSDFVEETLAAQRGRSRSCAAILKACVPGIAACSRPSWMVKTWIWMPLSADSPIYKRALSHRNGSMCGEKREREVAAAFLVDLSGSTSRQVEQGRRIIDIEKQGVGPVV